ncbi:hypothetical protein LOD99_12406 [Oopsacas minuta]|uniref:Uncharacterized protein n=1 Tax=Oopsacas minuta TaxID=111878 RepID=A0AAV7JF94_9METZ|nr:hypothetical protein LOD99_12406 [Oopsacas minuta]
MIWRESKNHFDDCYFSMVNVMSCKKSDRHLLNYPNLESVIRPVPHCSDLPVPIFTEFLGLYDDEDGANSEEVNDHDYEYDVDFRGPSSEPSLFNQAELNDLIRDFDLSKESSELLASRLKEKNLLHQGTKVTLYRYREQEFHSTSAKRMVWCFVQMLRVFYWKWEFRTIIQVTGGCLLTAPKGV